MGERSDPGRDHDEVDVDTELRRLIRSLVEERRVTVDYPLRHILVTRPRSVLHEQHVRVGLGQLGRLSHRLVVRRVEDTHLGALLANACDRSLGDTLGHDDRGGQVEQRRHSRDGAAVVAVGGGDQPGPVAVTRAQRAVHRPGGAEHLECGQPEA